ncbi:MAG: type II secretion system F family protein [Desulfurococcaceae archaeon]
MLRVDRELYRLFGVKYDEARKIGLMLMAVLIGLGAAVVAWGVLGGDLVRAVLGLVIIGLGPVMYLYPYFELSSRIRAVESELLPASIYASLYATAERDMLEGVYALAKESQIAPNFSKFVENVERARVQKLLGTPHEAFAEAARVLGEGRLKSVILAMATARSVGVSQELQARDILKSVLFQLKSAYQRVAENMKTLGEVVLVFYGVMPLMFLIMTSIFYSPSSAVMLAVYVALMIPLMGVALVLLVHYTHPKTPEKFIKHYKRYIYTIPISVGVGVGAYFVLKLILGGVAASNLPNSTSVAASNFPNSTSAVGGGSAVDLVNAYLVAISLGLGLAAGLVPVAVFYLAEWRKRWGIISALPFFTRDMAEMVKLGFSPSQALPRLVQRRSYGRFFDALLNSVGKRLVGSSFGDAIKSEAGKAPWVAAVVLNAMGEADRLGSKSEVFSEIADTSRDLVDILKSARSALMGAVIFGIVTIVIISVLLGTVAKSMLLQIASQSASLARADVPIPLQISLITMPKVPEVLTYTFVGAVLNALVLGVLIGKILDDNFLASAFYGAVAVVIATIAVALSIFI